MSKHRSSYLLAALVGLLGARGMTPDTLDPVTDRRPIHLSFSRQELVREGERLEPAGAVVCEFVFAPRRRTPLEWRVWSFDHVTLDRFFEAAEGKQRFTDPLETRPQSTAIYWEEA
jgi:hypothetical protein